MTATVISCAFAHRAPHHALEPPPRLRQPPLADFPCRSPASPHFFLSQPACARFEPVQPCQPQPATCPKGEAAAWQVGVVRQEAHDKAVVNLDSMSRPRKLPPQSPRANRQRSPAPNPRTPSHPMPCLLSHVQRTSLPAAHHETSWHITTAPLPPPHTTCLTEGQATMPNAPPPRRECHAMRCPPNVHSPPPNLKFQTWLEPSAAAPDQAEIGTTTQNQPDGFSC